MYVQYILYVYTDVYMYVCFLFQLKKVNNCLSIAPKTLMQTRNMEWPIAMSGSSSSILVGLRFRSFCFRRYSRVTLTCCSFDVLGVLDLILFCYFASLSLFFVWGISSESISGITPRAT